MLLLVLRKKLLAAWKAARERGKTKKMNLGGEPKETAVSREKLRADGSKRSDRRQPLLDNGGMEARAVEQAFIVEIV
jgi:hypothetical protein